MRGLIKTTAATVLIAALAIGGCRSTQEALEIGEAAERNPGPCPRAFALYDAARIAEFRDGVERFTNVGFTGEIALSPPVKTACAWSRRWMNMLSRAPMKEHRVRTLRLLSVLL